MRVILINLFCLFKFDASKELVYQAKDHAKLTSGVVNLMKRFGDNIITVYSEDVVKNPKHELNRLCQFLSVSCSNDYLNDCSNIIYKGSSKTRNRAGWNDEAKGILDNLVKNTPMLHRYKFDE